MHCQLRWRSEPRLTIEVSEPNREPILIMKFKSSLVLAFAIAFAASVQAEDKAPGKKGGKGGEQPYDAAAVVKKFDTNGDGKLSLEEYSKMAKFKKDKDPAAAAKKEFDEKDANHDGSVTADELKAAHDKKVAAPKGANKPAEAPATPAK